MLKYRRMGIGSNVAAKLFDKHRGLWEICYWRNNLPAGQFWKNVVEKYTKNNYQFFEIENSIEMGFAFEN